MCKTGGECISRREGVPLEIKRQDDDKPSIYTTFTRQVEISCLKDEEMSTNIATDQDHRSSTTVGNCDLISRNLSSFLSSFPSSSNESLSSKTHYCSCSQVKNDTLLCKEVEHFFEPNFSWTAKFSWSAKLEQITQ